MIDVPCPQCGRIYHSDPAHAGKHLKCTRCGVLIQITAKQAGGEQLESVATSKPKPSPYRRAPAQRSKAWKNCFLVATFVVLSFGALLLYHYRSAPLPTTHAEPFPGVGSDGTPTASASNGAGQTGIGKYQPSDLDPVLDLPEEQPKSGNKRKQQEALEPRPTTYNSLPTGTRIEDDIGTHGHGELTVENGTSEDAVIRLCMVSTDQTVRWFSVQAGNSARMTGIPEGAYRLMYTLGLDWSDPEDSFRWHPSYDQFERLLQYSEQQDGDGVRYHEISVTLNPVIGGNVHTLAISREKFLKGHHHIPLSR